jgi:lipase ATG15
MLTALPATLQGLISVFLWGRTSNVPYESAITFHLRHEHAITNDTRIIFSNVPQVASYSGDETQFNIPMHTTRIPRPKSFSAFNAARRDRQQGLTPVVDWDHWEVPTPDVSKRSTLYQLAKMSANSYVPDNTTSHWYDIADGWNSIPHGWSPTDDGLRGHIFVSDDNSTVIISMKGTSPGRLIGGGGPTVRKDKINDNLLFSCCCARVGPTWSTVCDCYDGKNRCDEDCIEDALKDDGLFYPTGLVGSILLTQCPVGLTKNSRTFTIMSPIFILKLISG